MVSRSHPCDRNRLRQLLDEQLRGEAEQQLTRHLEGCDSCRRELEALAADGAFWNQARQLLSPERPVRPDAHGKPSASELRLDFLNPSDKPSMLGRLGPYEVAEVIGAGGFGVVLKAFEPALNRQVAIKVLAVQLATSAAARRRFAREAQAAAAVIHDNVVAIHAVDETKGLPYLVMQYVAGKSLQERIDRDGPLELKEILRIGMQSAAGLAAAHAQGLVHRDVKPANILLENGIERVKLTDFGLARTVDDASVTQSVVVAGTPQYMAPEQAQGGSFDHRADLFSLGSVMYAMCTGHSPFRAETMVGVLRRVCDERPRPIRELNPDLPEWLEAVIARLHAKDPSERFQTAAEVAELLERYLAHLQQPTAVPAPPLIVVRKTLSSRRAARWLAAAAAALAIGAGWAAFQRGGPSNDAAGDVAEDQRAGEPVAASSRLAEWNRFDSELQQADQETTAVEWRMKQIDIGTLQPDVVFEIHCRLDALERELGAP